MLRIRLRRAGAKKKPSYRVVVADARAPRDGAFLDILGHYNPLTDPATVVIDTAKAQRWLANGAQPSDRVSRLFKREGIERAPTQSPTEAAAAAEPAPEAAGEVKPSRRRRTATAEETAGGESTDDLAAALPEAATEGAANAEAKKPRAPRRSKAATAEGE
jgi:small subunit ribosomal protein S16